MLPKPDTQSETITSKLKGLDEIEVVLVDARDRGIGVSEFWVNLLGFVILEVAIAIGWIAATGGRVNDSWKTVLIALAAAALGFGAARLLARRSSDSHARELERDYEELKERSRRLLGAIDQLQKPSGAPESGRSSGAAL
jgi:hypothetical protein